MAVQNNLMSVIALTVMVMILSGKRFAKAVANDTKLPDKPLADLKDTRNKSGVQPAYSRRTSRSCRFFR